MPKKNLFIGAFEAKTKFSELLAQVERTGAEFVITKHDRPVARLMPIAERQPLEQVQRVVTDWKSQRTSIRLKGLKVKDLINEGRR